MPYATIEDIRTLRGEKVLTFISDLDGDDVANDPALEQGLSDASSEIDTLLSVRFTLPFETVPPVLRKLCVDMAVYGVSLLRPTRPDEFRVRYEDAIKLLTRIADGKAGLGLPPKPAAPEELPGKSTGMIVSVELRRG